MAGIEWLPLCHLITRHPKITRGPKSPEDRYLIGDKMRQGRLPNGHLPQWQGHAKMAGEQPGTECGESVWTAYSSYPCPNRAKVVEDGKPYCGVHDPQRRRKREIKRQERWKGQAEQRRQARNERAREIVREFVESLEWRCRIDNEDIDAWEREPPSS